MKKLLILFVSTILCANTFASHFHHKKNHKFLKPSKRNHAVPTENFSGTWESECDGEMEKIFIEQYDKKFIFSYVEDDGYIDSWPFELNMLKTGNESFLEESVSSINFAF